MPWSQQRVKLAGLRFFRRTAVDGRRQAEDALRLLFEQVPAFIWTTDADLRIAHLSGQAARASHLTPVGTSLRDHWGPEDPIGAVRLHERALAGDSVTDESTFQGRTLRSIVEPLRDGSGAVVGVIGVAVDVTEERGREAQLRRAQKLDALGQLAGGIAHDYNNMLLAIGGNIDLALSAAPGSDVGEQLNAARAAVERSAELTRRLLAFGRSEPTRPDPTDVGAVVRETAALLRPLLGGRIGLQLALDPAPLVLIDPVEVEQIVMNLAINARDAMPNGGTIAISVGPVEDCVELVVADEGEGIAPEHQERLFEPFFTTRADGTGLGLATVYGIVTRTGGSIAVESEPGRGTRFRVRMDTVPAG
jgi:PAS domain S-box-containing protein